MNAAPILVEIMVPVLTLLTVLFANALNLGKGDCADHVRVVFMKARLPLD